MLMYVLGGRERAALAEKDREIQVGISKKGTVSDLPRPTVACPGVPHRLMVSLSRAHRIAWSLPAHRCSCLLLNLFSWSRKVHLYFQTRARQRPNLHMHSYLCTPLTHPQLESSPPSRRCRDLEIRSRLRNSIFGLFCLLTPQHAVQ